jgi:predicted DNA-binding WGR domain protein
MTMPTERRNLRVLPDTEVKLQCTEGTSRKFWNAYVAQDLNKTKFPWIVVLHWGRISTAGTKEEKEFASEMQARKYFLKRLEDKKQKKYISVEPVQTPVTGSVPLLATTDWDLE